METMINRRSFDISNARLMINDNQKLTAPQKAELLAKLSELSEKRKTMLQGAVFMLNNRTFLFDDLNHALEALSRENGADSLGMVEVNLQKQIDVISRMKVDNKNFTLQNKSLCLRSLQGMIDSLSTYQVKNGVNDYIPKYWQEKAQAQALAATKGLNWQRFEESMYSDEYHVAGDPKWKFFDREKMKQSMNDLMHEKTTGKDMIRTNSELKFPDELYFRLDELNGMANIGTAEITETSDEKISRIVVSAMDQFAVNNLRDHIPELFNFVKGEILKQNEKATDKILYDTVFAVMHKLVEECDKLQMKTVSSSSVTYNNLGGKL